MWIRRAVLLTLLPVPLLAGCASSDDREWMKPGGSSYTQADFKRDVAACTRSGKLDEGCMKERGWVAVTPPKSPESAPQPRVPRY